MPARDDAGSNYGRPGGSQNSGVYNGGVAGGMGGGFGGGGAGRMGGIGSRTGLTTGNTMFGGMAFGRPGGFAMNSSAFGVRPQAGIARGPLSGARPRPAAVAGVNPLPENIPALEDVPMPTFQDPMAMYTTLTPPPASWNPSTALPNANWFRTNSMLNAPNVTGRAYDARLSPRPDPLANDMSRFNSPRGAPLNIGGIQGGMGSPGYSNPGVPGFGGRR
jgi:hypothetical protein